MKIKCLLWASLLLMPLFLISQSDTKVKKLGAHLTYFSSGKSFQFQALQVLSGIISESTIEYTEDYGTHLGISFQSLKSNGWYQEYAINRLSFNAKSRITTFKDSIIVLPRLGEEELNFHLLTRFEIGKYFSQNNDQLLSFGLGISVDPGIFYARFTPLTTANVPFEALHFDLDLSIIPRIEVKIHDKLHAIMRIPVKMLDLQFENNRIESVFFREDQRQIDQITTKPAFSRFEIQLGIQYKLN